jgi:hypothetical protein
MATSARRGQARPLRARPRSHPRADDDATGCEDRNAPGGAAC